MLTREEKCRACPRHESDSCGYVSRGLQRKCQYLDDWQEGVQDAVHAIADLARRYVEKGGRCMDQCTEDKDQGGYAFWDGFHDCAAGILREVEEL